MKAILFDLDGTLLPMDQDMFTKAYFKALCKKLAPHGFKPEIVVKAMWRGIDAMLSNNGIETNEEVFWRAFGREFDFDVCRYKNVFDEFYRNEFDGLKDVCGYNEKAGKAIKELKRRGYKLVLATNPVFPFEAYEKRVTWAGADISDFELVTTYSNSRYCKPQKGYYAEILQKIGCEASECIMVGNDVGDDMPAADIGINVYLMPECLINKTERSVSDFKTGDFDALLEYIG